MIAFGYCHCGCGGKTKISPKTKTSRGEVKGQPQRFIFNHHVRLQSTVPAEDRFWAKVNRTESCWLWTAGTHQGYGKLKVDGRSVLAHRFAYETLIGEVPAGLTLDHLCRVRNCVNPAHLQPVPQSVNNLRGLAPPARNARKTHCKRGHELSGPNVRVDRRGHRECLTCKRERDRIRHASAPPSDR